MNVLNSKLNERPGNIYENKGPGVENQARSENLYENKRLIFMTRECS
jgi:hypothetical protein